MEFGIMKNKALRIIALPLFVVCAVPFALIQLVKWCIGFIGRGKDVYGLMKPVSEAEKSARELVYNLKEEIVLKELAKTLKPIMEMAEVNIKAFDDFVAEFKELRREQEGITE